MYLFLPQAAPLPHVQELLVNWPRFCSEQLRKNSRREKKSIRRAESLAVALRSKPCGNLSTLCGSIENIGMSLRDGHCGIETSARGDDVGLSKRKQKRQQKQGAQLLQRHSLEPSHMPHDGSDPSSPSLLQRDAPGAASARDELLESGSLSGIRVVTDAATGHADGRDW
jgi:hypothetical protein